VAEQLAQDEPGVRRALTDPAVRDGVLAAVQAGVDWDKDTIAYCRIGERSSHTWFVFHELLDQANVKNYDGSWTEYGSLVGVPVVLGDEPGAADGAGA
jgi:3-mercaptopyruvate sulfurtransferase SseA